MAWNESRKRTHNQMDAQDFYAGPEDFMEAGVRGFLVTTVPDKEELATDQAMKMLRKAAVKLYGGMKPPVKSSTALFSCGYIALDFVDPDTVTVLPNPEEKSRSEEQKSATEKEMEGSVDKEVGEDTEQEENKETKGKDEEMEGSHAEADDIKEEIMEPEIQDKEVGIKMEIDQSEGEPERKGEPERTGEPEKKGEPERTEDGSVDQDATPTKGGSDKSEDVKEKKDKGKEDSEGDKSNAVSKKSKSKQEEPKKGRENRKKRREEDNAQKWPLMKTSHKFKAYRTELRNIMFIKSDVPNPMVVAEEIMNLLVNKKPLKSDAINQLLPVQGICNFDYWEFEVMAKRVLAPLFPEDGVATPSFGMLVYDKLCDPGTDVLNEIIRSAVWSLNPMAWQSKAVAEPDVVIHVELIGSKIILSAMSHYMKYRLYSPFCAAEMGEGKCYDSEDESTFSGRESARYHKLHADKTQKRSRSRSRSRSERPHGSHKSDDSSIGKGKDKGNQAKSRGIEKDNEKKSEKEKKTEKEDSKKSEKGKKSEREDASKGEKEKKIEEAYDKKDEKEKKSEEADDKKGEKEKKNEEADDKKDEKEQKNEEPDDKKNEKEKENEVTEGEKQEVQTGEKDETEEPIQQEEKKTPTRRGGRRSASQKKK